MKHYNIIKEYGSRLAFLCAALALILFIPACLVESTGWRAFLIVLILLLLGGGGVLLYMSSARTNGAKVHYFLYDRRRGKSRGREELSAEIVQDAMSFYLQPFAESALELWGDIPKALRLQLEAEPHFRTLLMYRMLSAMSEVPSEHLSALFAASDERAVAYLCRVLSQCGDNEMADYIFHLKKNAKQEAERILSFFKKNNKCFEKRALHYVEQHFDDFYVDKAKFSK